MVDRAGERAERPPATFLALDLVGLLGVVLGLQLLRSFLPLGSFVLFAHMHLPVWAPALLAVACLSAGWWAPALARAFGADRALAAVGIALGAVRLAHQGISGSLPELFLAGAGSGLLALLLPLHLAAGRARAPGEGGRRAGLLLLAGVALEAAFHAALGTWDLVWRRGAPALLLAASLAVLLAAASVALWREVPPNRREEGRELVLSWRFLLVGPWLFLELMVFHNLAAVAAFTGLSLPTSALVIALGSVAAACLAVLVWLRAAPGGTVSSVELLTLVLAALTLVFALAFGRSPAASLVAVVLGSTAFGGVLAELYGSLSAERVRWSRTGWRQAFAAGGGFTALALLVTIFYANFALGLGVRDRQILAAAAVAALASVLIPVRKESPDPAGVIRRGLPLPVLLAPLPVVGLALLVLWPAVPQMSRDLPAEAGVGSVKVMTYNLHQGFDVAGRLDPEALARVIEASGAEIVGLQEVSRGWLVNGSLDLFEWLEARLGMEGHFAPTAGGQWGNALFSRWPVKSFENRPLPPRDLPLLRGVFDAEVALGDRGQRTLRILGTHLFHRGWGTDIRQEQVAELLKLWGKSPATLILGDLNAPPESAEMRALAAAGLHDAAQGLPLAARGTFPSTRPSQARQIDYLWGSPDVSFQEISVPVSTASDHLPVVVRVRLADGLAP